MTKGFSYYVELPSVFSSFTFQNKTDFVCGIWCMAAHSHCTKVNPCSIGFEKPLTTKITTGLGLKKQNFDKIHPQVWDSDELNKIKENRTCLRFFSLLHCTRKVPKNKTKVEDFLSNEILYCLFKGNLYTKNLVVVLKIVRLFIF